MTSPALPLHRLHEVAPYRPLRIAMVGQKGMPATFGGIEHHVEELGRRLVERGHEVTVYCRQGYGGLDGRPARERREHRGMRLVTTPAVRSKHLDAITHSTTSTAHALASGVDVVHLHALGPGLLSPLVRAHPSARVVQTIHGLDHERAKWGGGARRVLELGHRLSGSAPDAVTVVSADLRRHYAERFGRDVALVTNGAPSYAPAPRRLVEELLGLAGAPYLLFVGRLVPEKRPDQLLRAYARVPGATRLVLVGDSSFSGAYTAELADLAARDPRVLMPGYQYGETLRALHQHATALVQPSVLEGMPLTVLEALGAGTRVVASDIAPHVELLGERPGRHALVPAGDDAALAAALAAVVTTADPGPDGDPVRERVLADHSWDRSAELLERVYLDVVAGRGQRRPGWER
ncbi:glycosyltransferase family 4 protein [Pseudokineococcus sp. 1T1Z-3]|uniref:glycosyltransferase family 4 protein n=1 Tax=Pseudokineococcus sp. 1T1Z-3 TaxID=3132745 RepID=UPI0030B01153